MSLNLRTSVLAVPNFVQKGLVLPRSNGSFQVSHDRVLIIFFLVQNIELYVRTYSYDCITNASLRENTLMFIVIGIDM